MAGENRKLLSFQSFSQHIYLKLKNSPWKRWSNGCVRINKQVLMIIIRLLLRTINVTLKFYSSNSFNFFHILVFFGGNFKFRNSNKMLLYLSLLIAIVSLLLAYSLYWVLRFIAIDRLFAREIKGKAVVVIGSTTGEWKGWASNILTFIFVLISGFGHDFTIKCVKKGATVFAGCNSPSVWFLF